MAGVDYYAHEECLNAQSPLHVGNSPIYHGRLLIVNLSYVSQKILFETCSLSTETLDYQCHEVLYITSKAIFVGSAQTQTDWVTS